MRVRAPPLSDALYKQIPSAPSDAEDGPASFDAREDDGVQLRRPPSPDRRCASATALWRSRIWSRVSAVLAICMLMWMYLPPTAELGSLLLPFSSFAAPRPVGLPVLARTIALILCEGQAEIDKFVPLYPSVTADVVFYCWKESDCGYPTRSTAPRPELTAAFVDPQRLLVSPWTSAPNGSVLMHDGTVGRIDRHTSTLVTADSLLAATGPGSTEIRAASLYPVHPSVWVLNEALLGAKLSWTGSRNRLLLHVQRLEQRQQWRWAFLTFSDGDVHMRCDSLLQQLPVTPARLDTARLTRTYHYQWLSLQSTAHSLPLSVRPVDASESTCRLAYDAFLLTAAPARGTVVGVLSTRLEGVDAQVGYDMDAMMNSLQSAALAVLLPYCERFDSTGWWLSQILLNARAVCVFGHTLVMNDVRTDEDVQVHRDYPRMQLDDLYALHDQHKEALRLYPAKYAALEKAMQRKSAAFPAVLALYSGWWPELLDTDCHAHLNDTKHCVWT